MDNLQLDSALVQAALASFAADVDTARAGLNSTDSLDLEAGLYPDNYSRYEAFSASYENNSTTLIRSAYMFEETAHRAVREILMADMRSLEVLERSGSDADAELKM